MTLTVLLSCVAPSEMSLVGTRQKLDERIAASPHLEVLRTTRTYGSKCSDVADKAC